MKKKILLSEICRLCNLTFEGNDREIEGLGLCNRETKKLVILSYATSEKYVKNIVENKAIVALVISNGLREEYSINNIGRDISYIFSEEPEITFYQIHEVICKSALLYEQYDFKKIVGEHCNISDSAVIENGVIIGNNVTIGHNTVVKAGSVIEDNTTIGCNATIGAEGFQLITNGDKQPLHITHVGRCHICPDVYIGDHSCICNCLFEGETYIGKGTKIDNLVHIAHNVFIGENVVITAHVLICGSARIEKGAWIAPNSSIMNRVTVGAKAKVGLGSVVVRNVRPNTTVFGNPAVRI